MCFVCYKNCVDNAKAQMPEALCTAHTVVLSAVNMPQSLCAATVLLHHTTLGTHLALLPHLAPAAGGAVAVVCILCSAAAVVLVRLNALGIDLVITIGDLTRTVHMASHRPVHIRAVHIEAVQVQYTGQHPQYAPKACDTLCSV